MTRLPIDQEDQMGCPIYRSDRRVRQIGRRVVVITFRSLTMADWPFISCCHRSDRRVRQIDGYLWHGRSDRRLRQISRGFVINESDRRVRQIGRVL